MKSGMLMLSIALCTTPALFALDIEMQPGDHVYLNHLQGHHPIYDLVVHGIRLRNPEETAVTLQSLEVVMSGGERATSRSLGPADSRGASFEIAPGGTLDFGPIYLAAEFKPEEVRIVASFATAGENDEASVSLEVLSLDDKPAYRLPLEGSWYMRGIPSALSHHRWSMATEFGVDFFKTDAEGHLWDGDPVDAASYFGWADPVLAAADGVVEMVIADMSQDRPARMQRPDESREDYGRRLGALNQAAFQEHGLGAATGNLVVIRHGDGHRSAYGHLRAGSVLVAPGDEVRAGQKIAEVGDTGDSHHVHLHFQIMEAEVMRAVPFRFSDVEIRSREYGSWIRPQ